MAATLNITTTDAKNRSSITKIRVPNGFTPSQYGEAALAFAQLLSNMSEGVITEVSVSLPLDISTATIRAVALDIADIAKKALFTVKSSVGALFARFNIPTYNEAKTVTGSDEINTADPQVAALVGILENGVNVSGTFIQPVDLRGNDLATVVGSREIFRKYN